jgi:hypothetical protein
MCGKGIFSVAALTLTAVLLIGTASGAAAGRPRTISFLEVNTSFAGIGGFNPTGNAAPGVGQGFTFTSTLYKWAGTKKGAKLGHDQVVCTITSADTSTGAIEAQCAATNFLPGGTIQLAGPTNFNSPVTNVAVVGGTGIYVGAQGAARIKNIGGENSSSSAYVIHLTS